LGIAKAKIVETTNRQRGKEFLTTGSESCSGKLFDLTACSLLRELSRLWGV
jgi:hypothetical protein